MAKASKSAHLPAIAIIEEKPAPVLIKADFESRSNNHRARGPKRSPECEAPSPYTSRRSGRPLTTNKPPAQQENLHDQRQQLD
jgi:hypothetical protein